MGLGTESRVAKQRSTLFVGEGIADPKNVMSDADRFKREEEDRKIAEALKTIPIVKKKKAKKIIPWGNKILIKRRKVSEDGTIGKEGIILASSKTQEVQTEIADVVCVPNMTFCDEELIKNSETIINAHMAKAKEGNAASAQFLMDFKEYLRLKTIQPGKVLFVGKYVGIDFDMEETGDKLSFMTPEGIYGEIVENS